jgi:DNA repair exonuclease SbcCD nuclease subunit
MFLMSDKKVALITDQHFGIRSDSDLFSSYQSRFYENVFFPELEKRGIKTVINGGDIFDRRKYSNHLTMFNTENMFLKPLARAGIEMYLIVGNHDVYYKTTNEVNSPSLFFGKYENIKIMSSTQTQTIMGEDVLFVPWINNQNFLENKKIIETADPCLVVGHFDIKGFSMYKDGVVSEHGIDPSVFTKHPKVISGHYHTQSSKGNIHYIGNSFEFTWSDYNDPRGFWILDLETFDMEFIQNPESMFFKISYEGKDTPIPDDISGKYVKLYVHSKGDAYLYDLWLEQVHQKEPFDLQIIDHSLELSSDMSMEDMMKISSTEDIINQYIDSIVELQDDEIKNIKSFMNELYTESLAE